MVPCTETRPPPPIPPCLLAQNLSSKWIAPTDNVRPKLHDEYTHHHWFISSSAVGWLLWSDSASCYQNTLHGLHWKSWERLAKLWVRPNDLSFGCLCSLPTTSLITVIFAVHSMVSMTHLESVGYLMRGGSQCQDPPWMKHGKKSMCWARVTEWQLHITWVEGGVPCDLWLTWWEAHMVHVMTDVTWTI